MNKLKRSIKRPTRRQIVVLGIVEQHGPITASDLAYHIPAMSDSAARSVLSRLEARGLIDATYTNITHGRARGYFTTERGSQLAHGETTT